jgi:hypothetical protein
LCHYILHEVYCFYHDMFTLCHSHYGIYACIPSRATIPNSDGMDPNTRVYVVMCAWAPVTTSFLIGQ